MGTKSGARDGEEACEGSAWFYGSVVIVSSVTGPRSRALAERLVTPEEGPSPAFLTSPLLLRCPWGAAAALGSLHRAWHWVETRSSLGHLQPCVRPSVRLCGALPRP